MGYFMTNKLFNDLAVLGLFVWLTLPMRAAETQMLSGHVPDAVAAFHLEPLGRLPATNHLHIAINLPLRNNEELSQLARQVYNPTSTNFHRYLTPEQFTERFGPSKEAYQAIIDFAEVNGLKVTHPHPGRAIAGIDGTVADIERALHVKMLQYQHPTEARRFFAPDVEPSLDLAVPVLAISGLNNYEGHHSHLISNTKTGATPRYTSPGPGSGTKGYYLGADFRNAYAPDAPVTGTGQVVGLVESCQDGGYNPGDIRLYERMTGAPDVPLVPVFQNAQVGVPGHWNVEFSVDIEMVIAMAPGISGIILYEYVDTNGYSVVTDEEMYQEMASPTYGETRPNQISTSWSVDNSPAATNYLRQLMVQGQSFFYASGDGGAWPIKTNNWPGFNYLTLVGGTSLWMNSPGVSWNAESVWGGSSGGIFTDLPIPFYQKGINMTGNQGSTQCRNAPDVAMSADNNLVVNSYQPTNGSRQTLSVGVIGGTSCAAPLWAAFTALVNEQSVAQGQPTVGFLNPALYAIGQGPNYASCFHDITVGNDTNSSSPNLYFAASGYDLCTGWGTPTGQNMIDALVGMTKAVYVDFNYNGSPQLGTYDYPFQTLAQGTNAVTSGGTIIFKTAGSSPETMRISKPMTIISIGGQASVGN